MQLYPEMNKKGTLGVIKETFSSKGIFGIMNYNFKVFTEVIQHLSFFLSLKTMLGLEQILG